MTNQISELLDAYFDAAYQEGIDSRTHDTPDGRAQAIRSTLEAALKPGVEPIGYRYKYLNFMGEEVWSFDFPRSGKVLETVPVYTTAPPAQTPYLQVIDEELVGAYLDVANATDTYAEAKAKVNKLIAWHIQVATDPAVNGGFELKPTQTTVPPRLTDEALDSIRIQCASEFAEGCRTGSIGQVKTLSRAIETAVRRQFGVVDE